MPLMRLILSDCRTFQRGKQFNMKKFPLFSLALMGLVLLASCAKERDDDSDASLVQTDEVTRMVDAGVETMADAIVFRSDSDGVSLPECVVITDSGSDEYPRFVSLDFGEGCTDAWGRTRTGLMHLSMSAPWTEVGSLREVTFEDFTVTRPFQTVAIGVEGVRQLERIEPGEEGESRWARTINTALTHPDFTVQREFEGVRRWIAGEGDPDADQVWGLTGMGSHTRNGLTRSRTVIEELILDRTCGEPVSGVVEVDRPILDNGVMDYGDGECDGTATLSVGGEVYTIDL